VYCPSKPRMQVSRGFEKAGSLTAAIEQMRDRAVMLRGGESVRLWPVHFSRQGAGEPVKIPFPTGTITALLATAGPVTRANGRCQAIRS
jgi:hypothetical protein